VEQQAGTPAGNNGSRDPVPHGTVGLSVAAGSAGRTPEGQAVERLRRQLNHDIQQQLGTIMMLASVVGSADDVGIASRTRIEQILGEARWMRRLLRAYGAVPCPSDPTPQPRPVSVDRVAAEVVRALWLTGGATITLRAVPAWADAAELGLWRALRNVVDNAFRAVGEHGTVAVRVRVDDTWVVIDVDDDGPGFGAGPPGLASLGLGIVRDFTTGSGGVLKIGTSDLGGSRVRIRLPAAPPPTPGPGWG
jgi:signal transduction histidine kinase